MKKENITITCRDCGNDFEFTGGEQSFYEERGFALPIRCKECRAKKKAKLACDKGTAMHAHIEEKKKDDFEAMFDKFKKNTVKF